MVGTKTKRALKSVPETKLSQRKCDCHFRTFYSKAQLFVICLSVILLALQFCTFVVLTGSTNWRMSDLT